MSKSVITVTRLYRNFLLVTALLLSAIAAAPDAGLAKQKAKQPASHAQIASANDTARFLAGLPVAENSPLAPLTKSRSWIAHARVLDQAWARLDHGQLSRIAAWSQQNVSGNAKLMLYMFSGPDFLYANAFYPNATTYVFSALERVGPMPDMVRLSPGARTAALSELRHAMQTVLNYSFFITKHMGSDLGRGYIRGTLPVLYVFLARAGKTIQKVEFVTLNHDGSVSPRGEKAAKGSDSGVKITFAGNDGTPRTLYYFRTNLSNRGLKASGFRQFCEKFGPADSLIKSASYLLHNAGFSVARNFLLKQSAVLIQDDSGIPLRYFPRNEWSLHPFGNYLGPIPIFRGNYQRDMAKLFKSKRQAIRFGIGYRWRPGRSNVLMAVKKASPVTQ